MYLDYVLLCPRDGCVTAETCRLEVQLQCFDKFVDNSCLFLDCNKYRSIITFD